MYAFNKSESNLGRGEGASMGGTGERRPDEFAMMAQQEYTKFKYVQGNELYMVT
jgi:hypothetical protein